MVEGIPIVVPQFSGLPKVDLFVKPEEVLASCLSKEDNALLSVCLSFYEKLV